MTEQGVEDAYREILKIKFLEKARVSLLNTPLLINFSHRLMKMSPIKEFKIICDDPLNHDYRKKLAREETHSIFDSLSGDKSKHKSRI